MRATIPALLISLIAAGPTALAQKPLPEENKLREARNLVKDVFSKEIAAAQRPSERIELTRKLLQLAEKTADDNPGQYALFLEARDMAVLSISAKTATQVVDATARHFQIDAVQWKVDNLEAVAGFVVFASQQRELAEEAAMLMGVLVVNDDYETARQVSKLALAAAGESSDAVLQRDIQAQAAQLAALHDAYVEVKTAIDKLKTAPQDPAANLTVGKYRCFLKADWLRGLPMLALGSDTTFKALAQAELAKPESKQAYMSLADGWWAAAEKAAGAAKSSMQRRAGHWYRQALPSLTGFTKVRVEKRLATLPEPPPVAIAGQAGREPVAENRDENLSRNGGSPETTKAVDLALAWVIRQQDARNGTWSLKGKYASPAQYENTMAATGMSLLALTWGGHTHQTGKYKAQVASGLKALLEAQKNNGALFTEGPARQELYTHGLCTMTLCELFRRTKDPSLKGPAEKAVEFCVASQHRLGGWRYSPKTDSDTSATGWVVSGLHSARQAGLVVPENTITEIGKYLTKASKENGAKYGYQAGSSETEVMTAAGLLCRQHTGWDAQDKKVLAGADWLLAGHLPRWNGDDRNVYYWYYGTRLMHNVGGARWQKWSHQVHDILVQHQIKAGPESGSWDPVRPVPDKWGYEAGRLYTTCLSAYVLETFYLPPPGK